MKDDFPRGGITLKVIEAFCTRCKEHAGDIHALDGKMTEEVNKEFQMEFTSESSSSYYEMLRVDNPERTDIGRAEVFISHAWKYKFLDVVSALKNVLNDTPNIYIWFDVFCNDQHNAPNRDFQWWSTTFKCAIKELGKTIVIIDPYRDPLCLKRAWCLFEIFCTIETKSKFQIAMSDTSEQQFNMLIKDNPEEFLALWSDVDLNKAEAFMPSDKSSIFNIVERSTGIDLLNRVVRQALYNWGMNIIKQKSFDTKEFVILGEIRQRIEEAKSFITESATYEIEIYDKSNPLYCLMDKCFPCLRSWLIAKRKRECGSLKCGSLMAAHFTSLLIDLEKMLLYVGGKYYLHSANHNGNTKHANDKTSAGHFNVGTITAVNKREDDCTEIEIEIVNKDNIEGVSREYQHFQQIPLATPEELLSYSFHNLRCVEYKTLKESPNIFRQSPRELNDESMRKVYELARPLFKNETIDYFVSHCWHDSPEEKWECLQCFAEEFYVRYRRYPLLWIDRFCIDQKNISNSLRILPIILSVCNKVLLLDGGMYFTRLWCVFELAVLFTTVPENIAYSKIDAIHFGNSLGFWPSSFRMSCAECYDPNESRRLNFVLKSYLGERKFETLVRNIPSRLYQDNSFSKNTKLNSINL